jgi:hypothetical protein
MLPIAKAITGKSSALKNAGVFVGVAAAGFVGYRVYKNIRKNKDKREFSRDLKSMRISRNNLSYGESDYNLMVQDLLAAMDGSGTRESTIISLFTQPGMNKDDILHLIKIFGIRDYGNTGKPGWWSRNLWGKQPLNLIGWMKEEMSESELEKVREVFRKNQIPF